ncbi:MAG TPA: phospholipase D family protein [Burkholderiales bacterium]|nr:phospholipase D family protein [Burkholderiales bacterium]
MIFFRKLLLILAAAVVAGCATIPPGADFPRTASVALTQPETTTLGKAFAQRLNEHSGLGGFRLLPAGTDGFVLRAEMAAAAQRTIDVQYFIFHSDVTGKLLIGELLEAADRGVRVRMLLDDLNMKGEDAKITTLAAHPNVEIRLFNPASYRGPLLPVRAFEFAASWNRLTYRMHNKLFLVDNVIGIAGGRNVGDEYFSTAKKFEFGDFDVFAVGPPVKRLSSSFDAYWNSSLAIPAAALAPKPTAEALDKYRKDLAEHREKHGQEAYMREVAAGRPLAMIVAGKDPLVWARFQVLYDSPEKKKVEDGELDGHLLRERLLESIRNVKKELLVVTPYLVPGPAQMKLLSDIRARNVRVRILTNSLESTDVPVVHAGYRRYRVPLLELGVELYEVRTELGEPIIRSRGRAVVLKGDDSDQYALHAKVYVFDRSRVFVGSANFDHRSFRLNTEVGVMIDSPAIAQQVAQRFEAIAQPANSYQVLLRKDAEGKPELVWHTEEDGEKIDLANEPGSALRHLEVDVLSVLPIENQL